MGIVFPRWPTRTSLRYGVATPDTDSNLGLAALARVNCSDATQYLIDLRRFRMPVFGLCGMYTKRTGNKADDLAMCSRGIQQSVLRSPR